MLITLQTPFTYQEEIKKSRFIAMAAPAHDVDEAMSFLDSNRQPQANHNCWAYKIGDLYRFSDDGEPGGTAGKPIFNAIESKSIDQAVILVIRYFGGIKLGTGGLVRAYGGVAAVCLDKADKIEIVHRKQVTLHLGFDQTGAVYSLIERYGAEKTEETYSNQGISISLTLKENEIPSFSENLSDLCKGKVDLVL